MSTAHSIGSRLGVESTLLSLNLTLTPPESILMRGDLTFLRQIKLELKLLVEGFQLKGTHVGFLLREAILPNSGYFATRTVMGSLEHFMKLGCLRAVVIVNMSDELSESIMSSKLKKKL